MNISEKISDHMAYCRGRLEKLLITQPEPPKERLTCYRKNGHDYWRLTDTEGKRKHLSLKEQDRAVEAVRAEVLWTEIQDLKCEIEACNRYLNHVRRQGGKLDRLLLNSSDAYKKLVGIAYRPEDQRLILWAQADYEKSDYMPQQKKITTSQGLKVRSKSEALIAEALTLLGIPFRYEQVLHIGDEILIPDFTILNPITFEVRYIEYNGMMDDDYYISRYLRKTELYCRNGIIPDMQLLNLYETKDSQISVREIQLRIILFLFGDESLMGAE